MQNNASVPDNEDGPMEGVEVSHSILDLGKLNCLGERYILVSRIFYLRSIMFRRRT